MSMILNELLTFRKILKEGSDLIIIWAVAIGAIAGAPPAPTYRRPGATLAKPKSRVSPAHDLSQLAEAAAWLYTGFLRVNSPDSEVVLCRLQFASRGLRSAPVPL